MQSLVGWFSDNYKWLFDGIGGAVVLALLSIVVRRLFKSRAESEDRKATLTAQGSKVTNSPVASGTGIMQNVNSPTLTVYFHEPKVEKLPTGNLEIVFLGDRKPYLVEMPKAVITGRKLWDRRYRVGVRATGNETIANTRVVLEDCEPREHHGIHLEHSMQVMDAPLGTHEFSVRPGADPSAFIDVIYDESLDGQLRDDAFGLCYASPVASFGIPRGSYVLTLRVESSGMQSRKKFRVFLDSATRKLTMREYVSNDRLETAHPETSPAPIKVPGPEIVLEYEFGAHSPLLLRNLSGGSAYHVQIETMRIDDRCTASFDEISHIAVGDSVRILPDVQDRYVRPNSDEGKSIRDDFAYILETSYQTWGRDFDPVTLSLLVHYADRDGRKYQTQCVIEYDAFKKIARTSCEPPIGSA